MIDLSVGVGSLKGVGAEVARKLARLNIFTVGDLVNHFPRRYEDFSRITPIRAMKPGPVTFQAQILHVASRQARSRKLNITEAILSDGTGTVKAVWFNQPYLKRQLKLHETVFISGKLEFRNNDLALQSPVIEPPSDVPKDTARIVPIYPETEGLTSRQLRTLILPLVPELAAVPETLPEPVASAGRLLPRGQALAEIHFPTSAALLARARQRLAFEELFYLILTSLVIKHEIKTEVAPIINFRLDVAQAVTGQLGFKLTDAQRRAAWEILQDMMRPEPMNRLLEGDVGSGKTIVAGLAMAMALANGYQAALMVPTEILARQHFATIQPWLSALGYQVELRLGGVGKRARERTSAVVKSGQVHALIGTQALLTGDLEFKKLGLVIIDEQHRFGVSQRLVLKQKAGHLPHLLSLTATPIPRSLALTVYGDLDISIIDSLPPGRQQVQTELVRPRGRTTVYAAIDKLLAAGQQAFVVCPAIEAGDETGARSVLAEAERLSKTVFAHRRMGVLHGRLKAAEKNQVMADFKAGKLDILIATSVIEVGIDIPNASVMLIENADRFGLAALHQLRGRVGRGGQSAYCYLATDSRNAATLDRLAALERTNDGFRLAQIDLELRGPGQIYGQRQHGELDLQFADQADTKLIAKVRKAALDFLARPAVMLKYPQVADRVNQLKAVTSLD